MDAPQGAAGFEVQDADSALAGEVLDAFKWNVVVPADRIQVTVTNGWVTLRGKVDWDYQKAAAARAIRPLAGVRGVTNRLSLTPHKPAVGRSVTS